MATPASPDAPPPAASGTERLPGAEDHALLGGIQRDTLTLVVARTSLAVSDRLTQCAECPAEVEVGVQLPFGLVTVGDDDSAQPRRILLVDDEVGVRRSIGRFLCRHGYQVTDVPDAGAAASALASGRYDAIISDLRMPGLSGEGFFELLLCDFPDMARRIVFTSGDIQGADTQAFLARSGCPALQKPFELSELILLLAGICPSMAAQDRRASA
jgi:CheY-like chemotaxis protein